MLSATAPSSARLWRAVPFSTVLLHVFIYAGSYVAFSGASACRRYRIFPITGCAWQQSCCVQPERPSLRSARPADSVLRDISDVFSKRRFRRRRRRTRWGNAKKTYCNHCISRMQERLGVLAAALRASGTCTIRGRFFDRYDQRTVP